jgi:hypothetical protein
MISSLLTPINGFGIQEEIEKTSNEWKHELSNCPPRLLGAVHFAISEEITEDVDNENGPEDKGHNEERAHEVVQQWMR